MWILLLAVYEWELGLIILAFSALHAFEKKITTLMFYFCFNQSIFTDVVRLTLLALLWLKDTLNNWILQNLNFDSLLQV